MSKRKFKKYLAELDKEALIDQVTDLYQRFPIIKEYYDFIFNPKEDKLVQLAKAKISNEYFPVKRKKAKARRSVAQKAIKHFMTLGVEPYLIAEVMLYNLEIAQTFEKEKNLPESFYKSMLNSFDQAVGYVILNGYVADYRTRILSIFKGIVEHQWPLLEGFNRVIDQID